VLSGLLDLLWAFPVYLLAISLSIVLVNEGLKLGPVTIESDSPALPALILALVYVPYVARPVRAQVIALRAEDFVQAATAVGGSPGHILRRHILRLLWPFLFGFAPVVAAMMLLTEAALSVIGIGVQPPAASWGTLLGDGQELIYSRPLVAVAPGLAVVATVLSLNVLGDALRGAVDPRG
jgi:peptide/nickel transport system permease protein